MKWALCFPVLLGFAIGVQAQPEVEWGEGDSSALLEYVSEIQGQDDPPDELTRMLSDTRITVDNDVIRRRVREVWYYPSSSDVQNNGMDRIYFDEETDSLTINVAASVDNDGVVHNFERDTLKITDLHRDDTFTDARQAVIALPGLSAGSLSLIEYEVVTDRAAREMDWAEVIYAQSGSPVQQFRLKVEWPKNQSIRWSSSVSDIECSEGANDLACEGTNLPGVRYERGMNWADEVGQVAVGEAGSWDDVIERSLSAFGHALNDTRGSDALLDRLGVAGLSREEQIAGIHEFVVKDIRYVSMSEHGNAITPHSVASVLTSRYGDCKDKSAVLLHLLKAVGVEPYPVLVATDRNKLDNVQIPTMSYFNHMVVCFEIEGEQQCLDATDAYTDWQHTPAWIQGKVALELKPGEEPVLLEANRYRWRMDVEHETTFTESGGVVEQQQRRYIGEYAGSLRAALATMTREERTSWARKEYQQAVSEQVSPEFSMDDVDSLVPEYVIHSRADYDPFLETGSALSYQDTTPWLLQEIASLYLLNEHYDDYFPGLQMSVRSQFDVDGQWLLTTLSPELDFVHEFGSMKRTVTRVGEEQLLVETELEIPRREVKNEDIASFNRFLDILSRESTIYFAGETRH